VIYDLGLTFLASCVILKSDNLMVRYPEIEAANGQIRTKEIQKVGEDGKIQLQYANAGDSGREFER
jgi:hypothetical protein